MSSLIQNEYIDPLNGNPGRKSVIPNISTIQHKLMKYRLQSLLSWLPPISLTYIHFSFPSYAVLWRFHLNRIELTHQNITVRNSTFWRIMALWVIGAGHTFRKFSFSFVVPRLHCRQGGHGSCLDVNRKLGLRISCPWSRNGHHNEWWDGRLFYPRRGKRVRLDVLTLYFFQRPSS